MKRLLSAAIVLFGLFLFQSVADAACRKAESSEKILIDADSLRSLARVNITRDLIFQSLKDVSVPETSGCWSGATGNFDGQIISAGVLQWNYGQNSLQSIMTAYQGQFATDRAYDQELARIMPTHGKFIFPTDVLLGRVEMWRGGVR
jgi:hypothetical protein